MGASTVNIEELKAVYCPPLADETFYAIVGDYDLGNAEQLKSAQDVLKSISDSAEFEEATGFDPSGSSTLAVVANETEQRPESERKSSSDADTSHTTFSHSTRGSVVDLLDNESIISQSTESREREAETDAHIAGLQPLSTYEKEKVLIDAFPGLKPFDIKWTLKKFNDDIELAIEDLLNQTFLEETGGRHRGIDGFNSDGGSGTPKKKKTKKSRLLALSDNTSSSSQQAAPIPSAWETRRLGVDLITKLCGIDRAFSGELYQKYSGNIAACLSSIVAQYEDVPMDYSDEALEELTALKRSFSEIPLDKLGTILMICEEANSSPAEFCSALVTPPKSAAPSPPPSIKLDYKLAAPKEGDSWKDVAPKRGSVTSSKAGSSYADAGKDYYAARNQNFEKASAAYRKARSDPLMGGVAAYYAQEGRDANVRAKSMTAAAADALVAQQSTSRQLDLHGIGVVDAVRIAREAVSAWWARIDQHNHDTYTIITGKGTHSVGGVAAIRSAVGRMLIREGWKAEVMGGTIRVLGTTGIKKPYKKR